jgi:hypothetical protein
MKERREMNVPADGSSGGAWRRLRQSAARFSPVEVSDKPILITTVRKAMTHAIRGTFVHLVGINRLQHPFVRDNLTEEQFSSFRQDGKQVFVGHVARSMSIDKIFADAVIILVVRDPLSCVHSRARHLHDPARQDNPLCRAIQSLGPRSLEAAYHYAIFGGRYNGGGFPPISHDYEKIALAWLHRADLVFRYEDLRSPRGPEIVLDGLSGLFGARLPPDIALRVSAGLDPGVSATYIPEDKRSEIQLPVETILDAAMPGMRRALGY